MIDFLSLKFYSILKYLSILDLKNEAQIDPSLHPENDLFLIS